jgi:hypothetical protein
MTGQRSIYLGLNGIPNDVPSASEDVTFIFDPQGVWRPSQGDRSFDVERECVEIHDALAKVIFRNQDEYYALLPYIPEFLQTAGLNSESTVSRTNFEKLLSAVKDVPKLNELLYLYDCRKLVSGIQECTKETIHLQGEFYRSLNLDPLFYPTVEVPDGIRYITSPVVTNITAVLNFIFIRLHSLLDYTTKLAYEIDHLFTDFSSYPRLSSANVMFGDRKRLKLYGVEDTLFESCDVVTEIEVFRNLIIHDGLLDDMPKAYEVIKNGRPIEKFVLLPDRTSEGRLEKFKNRCLFYSREDKINLRLPSLLNRFQNRQVVTLKYIRDQLNTRIESRRG